MRMKRFIAISLMMLATVCPGQYRERYAGFGRTDGYSRSVTGRYGMAAITSFAVTDSGWQSYTFTGDTADVYIDGSLYGTTVSGTAFPVYATKGQRVDLVFSNPASVTAIDMKGAPLFGTVAQFAQFPNLSTLVLPDMDPKGHVVDAELLANNAFPADLTGWTEVETGGTVSVSGGVITVARVNGATSAGQAILTKGLVYGLKINVTAVSGTCQIQDNDGTVIKSITATGMQWIDFFSQAVSGEINVVAVSDAASISFNSLSVKALTSQLANGGFGAWTGVAPNDSPNSWNISQPGTSIITQNPSGEAQFIRNDSNIILFQGSLSEGLQYRVTNNITAFVSGSIYTRLGDSGVAVYNTSAGNKLSYGICVSAPQFYIISVFPGDVTIDDVAVFLWPDQQIGSVADLASLPLTSLTVTAASPLDWVAGALDGQVLLTTIYLDAVNWTVTEVNSFFASLVICEAAGAAGRDCTVTIVNMPRPTGQGLTDAATTLLGKGWTVNIPAS